MNRISNTGCNSTLRTSGVHSFCTVCHKS
uniref:Uncharacterized protein n=1 Tax=Anguilla anguilla TaxID=7936 RepID=A0A0E9T2F1_ANGAN